MCLFNQITRRIIYVINNIILLISKIKERQCCPSIFDLRFKIDFYFRKINFNRLKSVYKNVIIFSDEHYNIYVV